MKMKFFETASAGDTEDDLDELAPLERRRQELESQLRALDGEIAERSTTRHAGLLAGDPDAGSGSAAITILREERAGLSGAIATLDQGIAALEAKREAAIAFEKRAALKREFVAAKEAAETARTAAHRALREFLFSFPALMRGLRASAAEAREAAARAGQTWNAPDNFISVTQANIADQIETTGTHADPRGFE